MRKPKTECLICGRLWKEATARMISGQTCSKMCASIKGYLSGNRKETDIELKLQGLLLSLNIDFTTQKPLLGITVADVFIYPNVAIFADGEYWHSGAAREAKDKDKARKLTRAGYVVLRLEGNEILEKDAEVKKKVTEAYEKRKIKKKL